MIIPSIFRKFLHLNGQQLPESTIQTLHQPVWLGIVGSSSGLVNIEKTAELREQIGLKVPSLIGVNWFGSSVTADPLTHQSLSNCCRFLIRETDGFRPASKIIWDDQYILVSTSGLWQWSNDVQCYSLHGHTDYTWNQRGSCWGRRGLDLSASLTLTTPSRSGLVSSLVSSRFPDDHLQLLHVEQVEHHEPWPVVQQFEML